MRVEPQPPPPPSPSPPPQPPARARASLLLSVLSLACSKALLFFVLVCSCSPGVLFIRVGVLDIVVAVERDHDHRHFKPPPPTMGVVLDEHTASGLRMLPLAFPWPLHFNDTLLAWGGFDDRIAEDGWSYLSVHSNATQPNTLQARAAGFLEGALTAQRIWEYAYNHRNQLIWSPKLREYIRENNQWMHEQIEKHKHTHTTTTASMDSESVWWSQVDLVLEQQRGLFAGYTAYAKPGHEISEEVMLSLSMHSDMDTLCPLFGGCAPAPVSNASSPSEGRIPPSAPFRMKDHCSVIVKLVPEKDELYTAHTTWTGYEDMTRVYKMYELPYTVSPHTIVPGRTIAFSSYPGNVFSTDDWYTISSGLAVTETTIDNHNETLWRNVVPNTTLTWVRTMVANRLAYDGPTWAKAFGRYNSGTYNNEFHIVNYNIFSGAVKKKNEGVDDNHLGSLLSPHLLTVVDQMPGHMEVADMTSALKNQGYWASYNRPGLPQTYELANYTATVKAYGPHYSHKLCSRAKLFELLQGGIVDEQHLKIVMRFNRFDDPAYPRDITHQMCANGPSASNAISERGDLTMKASDCGADIAPQNEGGIDLKYTTAVMMEASNGLAAVAQSGPTYDDQPVFIWSTVPAWLANVSHIGQPDHWEFPYIIVDWSKNDDPVGT